MCVCVERGHVCIHKARFPSSLRSTQLFCLHCTLVWLFICKSQLLSSPDPILDLANSPVFMVWTSHEVVTTVQIMPRLHRIMDTCQVCEYPDSTMSKVLNILKWWMITTLNRNLLENQRIQNYFASYEVHIGHYTMSMLLSVLEIVSPCLYRA